MLIPGMGWCKEQDCWAGRRSLPLSPSLCSYGAAWLSKGGPSVDCLLKRASSPSSSFGCAAFWWEVQFGLPLMLTSPLPSLISIIWFLRDDQANFLKHHFPKGSVMLAWHMWVCGYWKPGFAVCCASHGVRFSDKTLSSAPYCTGPGLQEEQAHLVCCKTIWCLRLSD